MIFVYKPVFVLGDPLGRAQVLAKMRNTSLGRQLVLLTHKRRNLYTTIQFKYPKWKKLEFYFDAYLAYHNMSIVRDRFV